MVDVILLNKPFQTLSQFSDKSGRSTLASHINPRQYPGFVAAGRLDYDSEGLLLLTNNGALQHHICHPNNKQSKTYWIQVEGLASNLHVQQLAAGPTLKDGPTQPCDVKLIPEPKIWPRTPPIRKRANKPTSWLEITLKEGRNRQVRRMSAAVGLPTLRLIRTRIGDHQLDALKPGEHRTESIVFETGSRNENNSRHTNTSKNRRQRNGLAPARNRRNNR